MESIQLAQMLADLSDLNAAQEAEAAAALVNANKTLPQTQDQGLLKLPEQRNHKRVASAGAVLSRTGSPARFDKFGRKILTPPLTRNNSAQGSIPGTPRHKDSDPEDDVDRASTLMALYDIRAKIKQQDNSSILKAREKINALVAKQQAQASAAEKKASTASGNEARRSANYSYPRSS